MERSSFTTYASIWPVLTPRGDPSTRFADPWSKPLNAGGRQRLQAAEALAGIQNALDYGK
jgi:hypothetical protein